MRLAPRVGVEVDAPMPHVRLNIGKRVRALNYSHDFNALMVAQEPPPTTLVWGDADNSDFGDIHARRGRDGCQEVFPHIVGIAVEGGLRRVERYHRLYLFGVEANEAGLAPAAQLRRAACF